MKEINIRAVLCKENNGIGEIVIDTNAVSKTLFESFELIGLFEFIKREYKEKFATIMLLNINYTETGIRVRVKAFEGEKFVMMEDICDKLIKDEMNRIKKRFQGIN